MTPNVRASRPRRSRWKCYRHTLFGDSHVREHKSVLFPRSGLTFRVYGDEQNNFQGTHTSIAQSRSPNPDFRGRCHPRRCTVVKIVSALCTEFSWSAYACVQTNLVSVQRKLTVNILLLFYCTSTYNAILIMLRTYYVLFQRVYHTDVISRAKLW